MKLVARSAIGAAIKFERSILSMHFPRYFSFFLWKSPSYALYELCFIAPFYSRLYDYIWVELAHFLDY